MTARAPRLPSVDDRSGLGVIAQIADGHDPRLQRIPSVADRLRAVIAAIWAAPPERHEVFSLQVWTAIGVEISSAAPDAAEVRGAVRFQFARIRSWSTARAINALELALDHWRDAHREGCRPDDDEPGGCCDTPYSPGPTWDGRMQAPADPVVLRRERARISAIEARLARRVA